MSEVLREVKVFNNLTRTKEPLKAQRAGEVKFYSCGPTTYNFLHVGNARALVVGDLIHRILKALGHKVTFVRNFTDVDDKIIDAAKESGTDPLEHSQRFINECLTDMESLGMEPANHTPKVSETIPEIVDMIKALVDKGAAYEVDGEVFFNVPKFPEYGKLSRKDLESLQHGHRVEVDSKKQNPADFVLWKPAKPDEPAWDSPWGKGRPGWHIECSAMAKKYLGDTIDMHHGGVDLMFPHHENEIAQSETANGKEFCHTWCHNEFLNFGKEKMSKSLGNVVTIRDFVQTYGGEVLRQVLSSVHYRSRMEWSQEVIERAINDVERIHEFLVAVGKFAKLKEVDASDDNLTLIEGVVPKMMDELANDFNVPGAMAHYFSMIRLVNREYIAKSLRPSPKVEAAIGAVNAFTRLATGLVHADPPGVLRRLNKAKKALGGQGEGALSDAEIEGLLRERKAARQAKDFARADGIRDELAAKGVLIKDNPDGTTSWSFKS